MFEREEPINDVVAHHFLHVLKRTVETEWVLARLSVEDSKNVTLGNDLLACLCLCLYRGRCFWRVCYHAKGGCQR